jgi:mannose-6-phosphate isomerase-like protein (cupin superfamily)
MTLSCNMILRDTRIGALMIAAPLLIFASPNGVDYYSAADLQAKAKASAERAKPDTHSAIVTPLLKYRDDYTLFAFRNADGQAELHEHESDLYLVVDGEATLVTGGEMLNRTQKAPGEFIGSGISHGESHVLRKGDVVHIAPNVPHQLKLKPGQTFSYFVEKVK